MKPINTGLCAGCVVVVLGCGFLKKEKTESTATEKPVPDVEAAETTGAADPADAALEPSVKAGTGPTEKEAAGSAVFMVERGEEAPSPYGIPPGSYTLKLERASIVTGTVGGLNMGFQSVDDKGLRQMMGMLLPSTKKFGIERTFDGGDEKVKLKHPPFPFTIGSDDYPADPKDGRGRNLSIGPIVTNDMRLAGGGLTAGLVHFRKFKLNVTSMSIDGHALTMACSFEGKSVPDQVHPKAVYTISGSLKITGAELGLTHKD